MATYLFYDIETTGLNPAFNQVLQFAAIRTDAQFNELARHEILVKLRPDVIPSPEAMIAHCISPESVVNGLCEYEATLQIHALLNEPETISLGYNTLKFDDEFLRFSFHRNLLPPYTHQYANNCGRMDLLPIVTLFWLYKNEALEWPEFDGKVSLKLEHLKEANHLTEGTSHDALIDVEATVALARRLSREEDMWRFVADYFHKGMDQNRTNMLQPFSDKLPECYKFGLLINVGFGSEKNFQVPVLFLGYSEAYRNQSLWLRLDRPELVETTLENMAENTWVARKKYGEPGILLPAKQRFMERLDSERQELLEANKRWLENNLTLLQAISEYYCKFRYQNIPYVDIDAALYQMDFYSDEEAELCRQFHAAATADKIEMAKRFSRKEMRELGFRLLLRNYPDQIKQTFRKERKAYEYSLNPVFEQEALLDYKGERKLTPPSTLRQIKELKKTAELNKKQKTVLNNLEKYLKKQFSLTAKTRGVKSA